MILVKDCLYAALFLSELSREKLNWCQYNAASVAYHLSEAKKARKQIQDNNSRIQYLRTCKHIDQKSEIERLENENKILNKNIYVSMMTAGIHRRELDRIRFFIDKDESFVVRMLALIMAYYETSGYGLYFSDKYNLDGRLTVLHALYLIGIRLATAYLTKHILYPKVFLPIRDRIYEKIYDAIEKPKKFRVYKNSEAIAWDALHDPDIDGCLRANEDLGDESCFDELNIFVRAIGAIKDEDRRIKPYLSIPEQKKFNRYRQALYYLLEKKREEKELKEEYSELLKTLSFNPNDWDKLIKQLEQQGSPLSGLLKKGTERFKEMLKSQGLWEDTNENIERIAQADQRKRKGVWGLTKDMENNLGRDFFAGKMQQGENKQGENKGFFNTNFKTQNVAGEQQQTAVLDKEPEKQFNIDFDDFDYDDFAGAGYEDYDGDDYNDADDYEED